MLWVFAAFVSGGRLPRFTSRGGSAGEDLALQNVQARLRMVMSYFLAQLLPWVRRSGGGFLLVRWAPPTWTRRCGTQYDCSAAVLNLIGGVSKRDLTAFLRDAERYRSKKTCVMQDLNLRVLQHCGTSECSTLPKHSTLSGADYSNHSVNHAGTQP